MRRAVAYLEDTQDRRKVLACAMAFARLTYADRNVLLDQARQVIEALEAQARVK